MVYYIIIPKLSHLCGVEIWYFFTLTVVFWFILTKNNEYVVSI